MLTLLLILLIKKFRKPAIGMQPKKYFKGLKSFVLPIAAYFLLIPVFGQGRIDNIEQRRYNVFYKGSRMGTVVATRHQQDHRESISLNSDMRFRIVFPISIQSKEEVLFQNDILTQSVLWRQVNGKERVNRRSNPNCNGFSVLSLYFTEPLKVETAYSHAFGKVVAIKRLSPGKYRIDLPDGNFNIYNYEGGVCKSIEVSHSFIQLRFVLDETRSLK